MVQNKWCIWAENEDGAWETQCKNIFEIVKGTPKENKMIYCMFCGKIICEVTFKEEYIC